MMLENITEKFINDTLERHSLEEGNLIHDKLSLLFETFSDNTNLHDVLIKVACVNKIYSTAILNLKPVVDKIVEVHINIDSDIDFVKLVDEISIVEWKNYKRKNLSFASKYVHFLSKKKTPIYDSYIWILIKAYLNKGKRNFSFQPPNNYIEFYNEFNKLKKQFPILDKYNNYQIDKFLWQYGKELVISIKDEINIDSKIKIDLEKAKSELKRRIKKSI